jgi:hypothetical protein
MRPVVRPVTRLVVALLAAPAYRVLRRRIPWLGPLDAEFEKDIEQWVRGSLLLLVATKNFEQWVADLLQVRFPDHTISEDNWLLTAFRLLLAVAVIETMPDQGLFDIIHTGPAWPRYERAKGLWGSACAQFRPCLKGVLCRHLSRSSPVFAIIAVILGSTVGWVCYGFAIAQYLIIGLMTSRDKARDVLAEFDRQVARRREELIEEFEIDEAQTAAALASHVPAPRAFEDSSVANESGASYESPDELHAKAPRRQGRE